MKHIMLDLETMGTRPDAAIVAIGAVAFDHNGLGAEFYTTISLSSAMTCGGTVDADTVCWWMGQSDEARKLFQERGEMMPAALHNFRHWLDRVSGDNVEQRDSFEVWGNGADFDNVILASAYRNAGLTQPWGKFKNRCYRTASKLLPGTTPLARTGLKHHALEDAKYQAANMLHLLDGVQKLARFAEIMTQLGDAASAPAADAQGGAA